MCVRKRKKKENVYTSNQAETAWAFLPRTFFAGVGLGSFCAAMRADTRARVAVRRSGLYPRFAGPAAIPSARRPPERGRIVEVAVAGLTARGDAFVLRVLILTVPADSETSTTFELASPEYLYEWILRRLPGSLEKMGPSGTRFTMKELFPRRRSHWRSDDMMRTGFMNFALRISLNGSGWLNSNCTAGCCITRPNTRLRRDLI